MEKTNQFSEKFMKEKKDKAGKVTLLIYSYWISE
jgi:hypothetical protein